MSKGVFRVNPGSLFPAFSRLERAGHEGAVASDREQPPREILPPDRSGQKALADETHEWGRQIAAINRILEA